METNTTLLRETIGHMYEKTHPMLLSIFRKAHIPEEDCKDLVHEVFVKLITLDILLADHLVGLAVTIAYQKRTDWLRHHVYCRRLQNQWHQQTSVEPCEMECRQLLQAERQVIGQMTACDARVYGLSRFEGKTPQEITHITTLSLRAVEGRLYRTRKMVRQTLRAAGF